MFVDIDLLYLDDITGYISRVAGCAADHQRDGVHLTPDREWDFGSLVSVEFDHFHTGGIA